MRRLIVLALAGTIIADPACALDAPTAGHADPRMQTAAYMPNQIYPITLEVGHTTAITVSYKETITDIWGSDSADLKSDMSDHFAFLKAQREFTSRSLYIRTRRDTGESRLYVFQVQAVAAGNDADSYDLRFTYPADELAAKKAAWAKAAAERAKRLAAEKLAEAQDPPSNFRYVLQGLTAADWNLLPTRQVYDDGSATYFTFPGSMRVPVIYVVNPDGKEAVADYAFNSATGVATVHQLAAQWRLRDGDSELCVFNRAFDPVGVKNLTGTSSPDVVREVKP